MKSLWNAISFVAVVHLLAAALFVGWLWKTERLSRERLQTVRELFAITEPQVEQLAREAEQAAADVQREAQEAERRADPPGSSEDQLELFSRLKAQEMQVSRRLADERSMILERLEGLSRKLDQERAAFEAEKQAWYDTIEAERLRREDVQFAKTVGLLAGLPAKRAKQQLTALIEAGDVDQAVAYLDAMDLRVAGRILGEFKSDTENRLATELLERLRTFGLDASASGESAHDLQPADPRKPGTLGSSTD